MKQRKGDGVYGVTWLVEVRDRGRWFADYSFRLRDAARYHAKYLKDTRSWQTRVIKYIREA